MKQDKKMLFTLLKKQDTAKLLELLDQAYDDMTYSQRTSVFGDLMKMAKLPLESGKTVLKDVSEFYKESLKGAYYAPFDMNSKNYTHIPEETEMWFDRLGELLEDATLLSRKNEHEISIQCFKILFELIDRMEDCEEIVFAHEFGDWMIPGDRKTWIRAYAISLAETAAPQEFTEAMLPEIRRDSVNGFADKTYSLITGAAHDDQRVFLDAEIKNHKIPIHPSR
jgi:hypothetical protein